MRYAAQITTEGTQKLARFPDCPGCQTFADPGEDIAVQAQEALIGWLEVHLQDGDAPPRPRARPRGEVLWVEVPAILASKLMIRWARQDAGLTQAQLAKKAGVTRQVIADLEDPDHTPGIELLDRVMGALGIKIRFVGPMGRAV